MKQLMSVTPECGSCRLVDREHASKVITPRALLATSKNSIKLIKGQIPSI